MDGKLIPVLFFSVIVCADTLIICFLTNWFITGNMAAWWHWGATCVSP